MVLLALSRDKIEIMPTKRNISNVIMLLIMKCSVSLSIFLVICFFHRIKEPTNINTKKINDSNKLGI